MCTTFICISGSRRARAFHVGMHQLGGLIITPASRMAVGMQVTSIVIDAFIEALGPMATSQGNKGVNLQLKLHS